MLAGMDVDERNRIIGENLRKYRLLKGLTQDELAEGLCSVSQLSKVENGKTYVKRQILKQMADRLGVTVERVESTDAMLEELTETLQLAKDAYTAENITRSLELIEQVIDKSREFEYPQLLVEGLLFKCRVLNNALHDYEAVIEIVEHALQQDLAQDSTQKLMLLYEIGHAHEQNGHMIAAHDYYCRADEEFDNVDGKQPDIRLNILFNLVRCHSIMKNYRVSLRYAEKALKLAAEGSKHIYRLRLSYMIAYLLRMLGQGERAEKIYLSTLKEAQDNSFLLDVAIINNNVGELFQERGELGQANAHYQRALQVYDLLNQQFFKCDTILHIAELAHFEGDYQKAVENVELVLATVDQLGVNTYLERGKALLCLGRVRASQGNFEEYHRLLEESLAVFEKHHVMQEAYDVAIELAEALYDRGDPRSVEMYRKAVAFNKKSQDIRR